LEVVNFEVLAFLGYYQTDILREAREYARSRLAKIELYGREARP
jgi:hypothetical protein